MKSALWLLHISKAVTTPLMLLEGMNVIGRSAESHVCLPDTTVSRWHALIRVHGNFASVRDLESTSGTLIDGCRVSSSPIAPGQRIRFGKIELLLSASNELEPQFGSDCETDDPRISEDTDGLTAALNLLTDAQRKVFGLLLQGYGEKQIATILDLAKPTVHNHKMAIFEKFGVHTHPELLSFILRLVEHPMVIGRTGGAGSRHSHLAALQKAIEQSDAVKERASNKTSD